MNKIMEIASFDGYMLKGRLTCPDGTETIPKLVIWVNGSGAHTYLNRRQGFNFFDFFADEFSKRDVAFFSYNTRGADVGDNPPMFTDIDEDAFQTYLPLNSVEDIYYMVNALKTEERLRDSKVYLLGCSEGTIISPLVAEKYPNLVDALFLWGYANENMKDILTWQNNGGSSMVWYRSNFESDEQGRICKASYEADPNGVIATVLQNTSFEDIDVNKDGYITEDDFIDIVKNIRGFSLEEMFSAIERRDDVWIRSNYGKGFLQLTSGWFLEHFSLRNNIEVLPTLNLPMFIFHGVTDQSVDVRQVYRVHKEFERLGKTNLKINVFENHDHDLNYIDIIQGKGIPEGIKSILDTIDEI